MQSTNLQERTKQIDGRKVDKGDIIELDLDRIQQTHRDHLLRCL